jgi:predicted NACHT family NTPase
VSGQRFLRIASEAYRRRCLSRYRALTIGRGPFQSEASDRIFPLRLRPLTGPPGDGRIDLLDLLGEPGGRQVALLGGPGAGKTTLLLRTALRICESKGHRPAIPIVLRLKGFQNVSRRISATAIGDHLLTLLARELSVPPFEWSKEDFHHAASRGWCLFLLDGIDEVGPEDARLLLPAISRISRTMRECKVVLSSRTAGYRATDDLEGFEKLEIEPVDPLAAEAGAFLRSLASLRDYAGYFQLMLEREPHLRSAVTTPLRLLVAAFVFRDQGGAVPSARLRLYEAASDWFRDEGGRGAPQEVVSRWLTMRPEMCLRFLTILANQSSPDDPAARASNGGASRSGAAPLSPSDRVE